MRYEEREIGMFEIYREREKGIHENRGSAANGKEITLNHHTVKTKHSAGYQWLVAKENEQPTVSDEVLRQKQI